MPDRRVAAPLVAWGIVLLVGGSLIGAALLATGSGKERSYNERAAIILLRKIADAEKVFRDADLDENGERDYWAIDVAGLASLKRESNGKAVPLLPAGLARSDPRPRTRPAKKPVPYFGYHFAAIRDGAPGEDDPETHPASFAFCATPAEYGKTGRETFVINERGAVHSYDGRGGPPPSAWPAQAEPVTRIVDE